jgi:transposase-like protein
MLEKRVKSTKSCQRTFYRYSECFKEKVIQEVSQGSSISEVCRRYDIKNMSIVSKWLKKYGRHELLNTVIRVKMRSEDDRIKQLEAENKRLKISLADAVLVNELLETLVEVVDEHYQTDIKKNFGQGLFPAVGQLKTRKK